jgi:tetratricopeptide (TPR) repeat protein
MHRTEGRLEDALNAAQRLAEADPDDELALVESADLLLALGRLDEALDAYVRLRDVDDEADHGVYAVHGAVQVEMRRGNWARAYELAQEAVGLDTSARSESLLGFFAAQAAAPSDRPGRGEVEAALIASQAEHRRLHSDAFAAF